MSESEPRRGVALVTGASGGLGRDFARLLARDGNDLVVVARNTDALTALAEELTATHGVYVAPISLDLSRPGASADLTANLSRRGLDVHTLINNAGFGMHGRFDGSDPARVTELLQLNVVALTELTRQAVAHMRDAGHGRILNVASTAAFVPGPYMAAYYASKAYVLSFSEALAFELRGTGVTVTALCPGPTRTGFQEQAGIGRANLFRFGSMQSALVAESGYRAMLRGDRRYVPGLWNRVQVSLGTHAPRFLSLRIIEWLHRLDSDA